MLCYAMLCYAMLCCAMLCYAVLCCAMLCYAVLCCAMLCYAVLCYAMLCYAMLCYAMLCCCQSVLYCHSTVPSMLKLRCVDGKFEAVDIFCSVTGKGMSLVIEGWATGRRVWGDGRGSGERGGWGVLSWGMGGIGGGIDSCILREISCISRVAMASHIRGCSELCYSVNTKLYPVSRETAASLSAMAGEVAMFQLDSCLTLGRIAQKPSFICIQPVRIAIHCTVIRVRYAVHMFVGRASPGSGLFRLSHFVSAVHLHPM